MIGGRDGIADIRLDADAVPAVLVLAIDDISGNAVGFGWRGVFAGVRQKHRWLGN